MLVEALGLLQGERGALQGTSWLDTVTEGTERLLGQGLVAQTCYLPSLGHPDAPTMQECCGHQQWLVKSTRAWHIAGTQ